MIFLNDLLEGNYAWRSVRRFLTVGMLGTLVDLTLFTALRIMLGLPTLAANTLSYSAGILNNYVLHRRWTYADRPHKSLCAQFSQFAAISLSALLLNNLLVLLLAPPLSALFVNSRGGELLAKVCATSVGLGWNFLANNFWTFAAAKRARR